MYYRFGTLVVINKQKLLRCRLVGAVAVAGPFHHHLQNHVPCGLWACSLMMLLREAVRRHGAGHQHAFAPSRVPAPGANPVEGGRSRGLLAGSAAAPVHSNPQRQRSRGRVHTRGPFGGPKITAGCIKPGHVIRLKRNFFRLKKKREASESSVGSGGMQGCVLAAAGHPKR